MKNQIVYNLKSTHKFYEYGIEIPLLNERVEETVSWLKENFDTAESEFLGASLEDLAFAHDRSFIERILSEPVKLVEQTYELVNSDGSYNRYVPANAVKPLTDFIEKAKIHVMGTYLAACNSLETKFCYHLGGGMHHAMSSRPGGFCMFNDLVIAIRKLQQEGKVKTAAIIDIDCHKGDGPAEITKNDSSIKTFSIHMKNGWPLDSDTNSDSFIPSDMDIPVENSKNYLQQLEDGLTHFLKEHSNLDIALVVHGVDVWENDILPSSAGIKLTSAEVLTRDMIVFETLKDLGIAQAWCLGGGYGPGVSDLYIQFLKKVFKL